MTFHSSSSVIIDLFIIFNSFYSYLQTLPSYKIIKADFELPFTSIHEVTKNFKSNYVQKKIYFYYKIGEIILNTIKYGEENDCIKNFLKKVYLNIFIYKFYLKGLFIKNRLKYIEDINYYIFLNNKNIDFVKEIKNLLKGISLSKFDLDINKKDYLFSYKNSTLPHGRVILRDYFYIIVEGKLVGGYIIFKKYVKNIMEVIFYPLSENDIVIFENNLIYVELKNKLVL